LTSQREFAIPIVLTKGRKTKLISIRTSQSTWIAFPRDEKDEKWGTLSDVDAVVAAWVDDAETPRFAQVHLIPGDEMRDRFDRAYAARKVAGHSDPARNGLWVSLYHEEAKSPANRVGAGAPEASPIARVPLLNGSGGGTEFTRPPKSDTGQALTIQEANGGPGVGVGPLLREDHHRSLRKSHEQNLRRSETFQTGWDSNSQACFEDDQSGSPAAADG